LRAYAEQVHAGQRPARPATDITTPDRDAAPSVRLTQRQLEVLALLCEGLPNKLICRRLNIATGTVKVHISCILRELGVTSRLQAVVAARHCGLLGEAPADTPEAPASSTRYPTNRDSLTAA
jgi:DNA-binding NarL/FixJ family response regulator